MYVCILAVERIQPTCIQKIFELIGLEITEEEIRVISERR